ncbi:hypothetical protein C8R44DRAFT_876673 [Mycena epipterygia]|nr:hypothetical protein C8R44DRAFT_876673 [Mycena epipterygia]
MVNKPRKALSEIATSDDEMDDFIDDAATQDDPSFENDDSDAMSVATDNLDLGDEASYDVIDPTEIASETEEPEGDPRPPAAPKRAQVKATPVVSQRKNPAKVAKKGAKSKMKTTSDVEMEDEESEPLPVASQWKSPAKVAKKGTKSKKEATPEMETEDEELSPDRRAPLPSPAKGKTKSPAKARARRQPISTEILEISDTDEGMPVSVPLPPKSPAKKAAAKKATPKKNNLPVPSRSTRATAKKKQNTAEKRSINSMPIQSEEDEEPKAPKRPRHGARPETPSTTPSPRKSPLKRSSEKTLGSVIESIYEEPKKDEDEEIGSSPTKRKRVDMKGKSKASPAKKYKSAEEVQSNDGDESPTTIGFVSARTQLNLSDKKVVASGKNSTAAGKKTAPGAPALGLEKKSQVLTFAQQLKIAPVDANIRIPAPELGLFKAPDVCAVNNPAIHDPVLKVDYEEGILARLPDGTFRGWGSSDVGDNFGFFFSHWGVYAPHVPYGNTLFPVKFEKYGRFVNLARVHPGYVHCKVAQGNLGMYTADGLAICLTPGSVVESALIVQAENRRKSIDIQLYTQEYQRFQAVICARLYPGSIELRAQVKGDAVQFNTRPGLATSGSSPKKMTQLVTRLSLDGSDTSTSFCMLSLRSLRIFDHTVPVFDARDTILEIQHLANLPKGLPFWTAELPARSCVIVGRTVGGYDGVNVNLNLHFVVLIGLPAGYEPE